MGVRAHSLGMQISRNRFEEQGFKVQGLGFRVQGAGCADFVKRIPATSTKCDIVVNLEKTKCDIVVNLEKTVFDVWNFR